MTGHLLFSAKYISVKEARFAKESLFLKQFSTKQCTVTSPRFITSNKGSNSRCSNAFKQGTEYQNTGLLALIRNLYIRDKAIYKGQIPELIYTCTHLN